MVKTHPANAADGCVEMVSQVHQVSYRNHRPAMSDVIRTIQKNMAKLRYPAHQVDAENNS